MKSAVTPVISELSVKSIMPPATAHHRPQMLFVNLAGGQRYEYRPALVDGVLQWVLRPVYHLAYFIQRFIRKVRTSIDFWNAGYNVRTQSGGQDWGERQVPFTVDHLVPRVPPGEF